MSGKILLTGATGFVGRQILTILRKRSIAIRAVVRTNTRHRLPSPETIELIETEDLFAERIDWWARVCDGVDIVIHAAWYAEPGMYLQSPKNMACLEGTLALAQGCVRAQVRRFVGIGTCLEYDLSAGTLSVSTPLLPSTPYAGAKAAAFLALSNWLPPQGIQLAWCRLFYLYGEGEQAGRLVPYLRQQLAAGQPADLTDGTKIRDYLDVRDAARTVVDIALGDREGAINICSGRGITLRELAERIADEYGRRDLLKFGARPENLLDPPCVVGDMATQ